MLHAVSAITFTITFAVLAPTFAPTFALAVEGSSRVFSLLPLWLNRQFLDSSSTVKPHASLTLQRAEILSQALAICVRSSGVNRALMVIFSLGFHWESSGYDVRVSCGFFTAVSPLTVEDPHGFLTASPLEFLSSSLTVV